MNDRFVTYDGLPVRDRESKLAKKRGQMKLNGRALKRLLNDRAAKAQAPKGQKENPSHGR